MPVCIAFYGKIRKKRWKQKQINQQNKKKTFFTNGFLFIIGIFTEFCNLKMVGQFSWKLCACYVHAGEELQ